jgi:hypothetical protein
MAAENCSDIKSDISKYSVCYFNTFTPCDDPCSSGKSFSSYPVDPGRGVESPPGIFWKIVDRVLEVLMGLKTTRPEKVSQKLSKLYETISKGELDQAAAQVDELRRLIGEDPELVKASVLIKRREILGK